jgi:signal transduction histidine kinase
MSKANSAYCIPQADRDETPAAIEAPKVAADLFLSVSHDLFAVGALHRSERDAFNHALRMCSERRSEPLRLALTMIRANASRVRDLCVALENKLLDEEENR